MWDEEGECAVVMPRTSRLVKEYNLLTTRLFRASGGMPEAAQDAHFAQHTLSLLGAAQNVRDALQRHLRQPSESLRSIAVSCCPCARPRWECMVICIFCLRTVVGFPRHWRLALWWLASDLEFSTSRKSMDCMC